MSSLGLPVSSITLKSTHLILEVSRMVRLGNPNDPQLVNLFHLTERGLEGHTRQLVSIMRVFGIFTLSFENSCDIYITVYISTFYKNKDSMSPQNPKREVSAPTIALLLAWH